MLFVLLMYCQCTDLSSVNELFLVLSVYCHCTILSTVNVLFFVGLLVLSYWAALSLSTALSTASVLSAALCTGNDSNIVRLLVLLGMTQRR